MKILIVNESQHSIPRAFIDQWAQAMSQEFKRKKLAKAQILNRELTLVFLDQKAAKKINNEFRGKNYATDVLSFESMDTNSFGELILCPEVLKRQAKAHKLSFKLELGYMLLHGILHLLGYDHEESEKEAREMFAIQDSIFEKLSKAI